MNEVIAKPDYIHRQINSIRIEALKAASTTGVAPDKVLTLADKFFDWITAPDDAENAR